MTVGCKELKTLTADFLTLSDSQISMFEKYAALLLEWNEKMNLTAITEPEEIVQKHFYDCLLFFKHIHVAENESIIDVGTGAGFPGLVLKIARPDIKLTLLDGLNKRLVFLKAVLDELGLTAEIIHSRAEDGGKDPALREKFGIATARAVANMNVLSEYCVPYVKKGGTFVALKGASGKEEAENAVSALSVLGCEKPEIFSCTVMENEKRTVIKAEKTRSTPPQYPRPYAKISKKPL